VDFKKNLFWILVIVIVLAGVGLWAAMVPSVESDTNKLRNDCKAKAEELKKLADQGGKGDSLPNSKHVELANRYSQKLTEQVDGLRKDWESRKLDLRFENAPTQSGQFDIWLSEMRQKITKQAADTGLQLPSDAEKLMFKEPATDDNSQRIELHRGYRLRQMAIIEEVVGILSRKYGKLQVLKFLPDKDTPEPQEQTEAGALALERLSITLPRGLSQAATSAEEKSSAGGTSEGRARTVMEEALRRSGTRGAGPAGKTAAGTAAASFVELPYGVTSLDIQFVAPLAAVPAIAKALESSNRWSGAAVVSRIEYERNAPPYPAPTDAKLAKAGPAPGLNTHYQEGPVRALVSLDLYEYDEAKAKAAAAPPTPPKKDAKK